jgi:hypothetical protein
MAPRPIPAPVQFLRDRFGGDFQDLEATTSVDTAAVKIVDNDPEAVALTLINLGTDDVYVAPSNTVSDTAGIELNPGGSVSLTVRDDGMLPTRDWWAIGASNGQTIYSVRVRRYVTVAQAGSPGA